MGCTNCDYGLPWYEDKAKRKRKRLDSVAQFRDKANRKSRGEERWEEKVERGKSRNRRGNNRRGG